MSSITRRRVLGVAAGAAGAAAGLALAGSAVADGPRTAAPAARPAPATVEGGYQGPRRPGGPAPG
ncbi:tyrosinase, partial [Streptomyces sp. NPDC059810]